MLRQIKAIKAVQSFPNRLLTNDSHNDNAVRGTLRLLQASSANDSS